MSRFNLRRRPRISYYEPEDPDLDEYVFCDKCDDYVFEYCAIHGPLLVVPDDKVPSVSKFPAFVPRAALTIPHVFLHLAYSRIPGAGIGVFATRTLPRGVRFGPYRGVHVKNINSGYCWQIYDGNRRPKHVVDATDADRSNWLRYVNCARHCSEQNLVAYQYQGQLYYRTIKLVPRFEELLVFYGSEFANLLGISLKEYNKPNARLLYCVPAPKKARFEEAAQNQDLTNAENLTEENQIIVTQKGAGISHQENTETARHKESPTKTILKENEQNLSHNLQDTHINNTPDATKRNEEKVVDNKDNSFVKNNIRTTQQFNATVKNVAPVQTNSKTLSCDICDYTTYLLRDMNAHLIAHAATTRFSCELCSYITVTAARIQRHKRIHTGEKPYSCDISQAKFSDSSYLTTHKRIHTGEKPYSCDICHAKFSESSTLTRHKRIHTGEKPYSCDICQAKFSESSNLTRHKRIHTGEKPYSCDICQAKFSQSSALTSHKRIHTGEKPYSCDICQAKFSYSSHLTTHKRIHTGEKPYSCDICQAKFSKSSNLTNHKRIHTGEKPYSCDICQAKFSESSTLTIHKRIHTGEKPYSCDICQAKFSHSSHLTTHKRIHTGEKPYSCDICQAKFSHRNSLKRHKIIHTDKTHK